MQIHYYKLNTNLPKSNDTLCSLLTVASVTCYRSIVLIIWFHQINRTYSWPAHISTQPRMPHLYSTETWYFLIAIMIATNIRLFQFIFMITIASVHNSFERLTPSSFNTNKCGFPPFVSVMKQNIIDSAQCISFADLSFALLAIRLVEYADREASYNISVQFVWVTIETDLLHLKTNCLHTDRIVSFSIRTQKRRLKQWFNEGQRAKEIVPNCNSTHSQNAHIHTSSIWKI